jgi:hypothetical protein
MKPIISKAKENIQETKKQVFLQTATLANSAFALVAALAWNEAIKALIDKYVPAGDALYSKFAYAAILTVIVVLISMRLTKIINGYKPEEEEKK